jgi:hypothetical protein
MANEGEFPKTDGDVLYASEANAMFYMCPIGSVIAWLKSYTNTPSLPSTWVECNGQTLSDADSVFDGQVIPNLNTGSYKMLRGLDTSGTTGGSDAQPGVLTDVRSGSSTFKITTVDTAAGSNIPAYYSVVWIMRIK